MATSRTSEKQERLSSQSLLLTRLEIIDTGKQRERESMSGLEELEKRRAGEVRKVLGSGEKNLLDVTLRQPSKGRRVAACLGTLQNGRDSACS